MFHSVFKKLIVKLKWWWINILFLWTSVYIVKKLKNAINLLFSEPILNLVLYCLQQGQIGSAAANCLQSICTSCRDHMTRHFSDLLQILQSMDTFPLSNNAAIGLIKGLYFRILVHFVFGNLITDYRHRPLATSQIFVFNSNDFYIENQPFYGATSVILTVIYMKYLLSVC